MANPLAEFLEERKSRVPELNWEKKKKDWLDAISRLYAKIEGPLQASMRKGVVTVDGNHQIELTEDFIGSYQAPELRLTVGHDRVVFTPKGIGVIGVAGRVDMQGDRDVIPLIWKPEDEDGEWHFLLQRVPRVVMVPLDEDSLVNALQRVMAP